MSALASALFYPDERFAPVKKSSPSHRAALAAQTMAAKAAVRLLAQTTPFSRTVSPRQSQQTSALSSIAHLWQQMDITAQDNFQTAADILNAREQRTGRKALSAYMTFSQLALSCLTCGMAVPQAPVSPDAPPSLPPLALEASLSGGALSLVLHSPGYAHAVQISARPPVLPSKTVRPKHGFSRLLTPMALPDGTLDLTRAFVEQQGVPAAGSKLALTVVPMSACGVCGPSLLLTALVATSAARRRPA